MISPLFLQYTGYFATVLKALWSNQEELIELLGKSTVYIERSNPTTRLSNARLTRKTLVF
jgi:IS1 family transposase